MVRRSFDVLILGGGTAGCVLAARLSEDPGRTVCLVEAGPDYGPFAHGGWPEDMLDARWLAFSHSWETEVEDRSQLRARILGGCSSHNACVVLRGDRRDYDEWGQGWSSAELEPYLDRAEGELQVRRFEREELSPWHAAFAEAAGAAAIVHPVNAVGTVRWNTAFAYLDRARSRGNLTIAADTLVDRVLFDRDRAIGAVTSAGPFHAETVVVSSGAYGSAGILLRSGLDDLPVGENLIDHVGAGVGWEPTERLLRELDAFAAAQPVYMGQVTIRHDDRFLFPALDAGWEVSGAAFAMKPRSRGRVSLVSQDPRVPLRVEHGFLTDPADAETVVRAVDELRAFAEADAVRPLVAGELRPGPGVDSASYVRENARGFFHPVGTCAIGSVVDSRCCVLGRENLHVADASVMPTIPNANTNLSVVAIAERLGELLAD